MIRFSTVFDRIISMVEALSHNQCLSPFDRWEAIVQSMFESFWSLRSYCTINVWVLSTVEKLSYRLCLSPLNSWEAIVQLMFESSQWLKTYRTAYVWVLSMIESLLYSLCLSLLNGWKPIVQLMFESSQWLKTYRTAYVWVFSMVENLPYSLCLSLLNGWKPISCSLCVWVSSMVESLSNRGYEPSSWLKAVQIGCAWVFPIIVTFILILLSPLFHIPWNGLMLFSTLTFFINHEADVCHQEGYDRLQRLLYFVG